MAKIEPNSKIVTKYKKNKLRNNKLKSNRKLFCQKMKNSVGLNLSKKSIKANKLRGGEKTGKLFLSGALAGTLSRTARNPMERIKILKQCADPVYSNLSIVKSFSEISHTEGLMGL